MAVFKNGYNGYEISFSDSVAEKLENLWDADKDKFEELTDYIYEQFDWVSGICTDAPTLFQSFATKKEAELHDVMLSKAIHKWFRDNSDFLTEMKIAQMVKIASLVAEWIDYVDDFGNECAYTDSILELIKKKINKL